MGFRFGRERAGAFEFGKKMIEDKYSFLDTSAFFGDRCIRKVRFGSGSVPFGRVG